MQIGFAQQPDMTLYPGLPGSPAVRAGQTPPALGRDLAPPLNPELAPPPRLNRAVENTPFTQPAAEAGAAVGRMSAVYQAVARLAAAQASPANAGTMAGATSTEPASTPASAANPAAAPDQESETEDSTESDAAKVAENTGEKKSPQELTPEEQREVQALRQRDLEVRAHEQAHVAAGGRYVTKAPSYDYETGPDGQRYAVGGEVSIDTSPVAGDPRATMEKARIILRAALAPAEPSTQDQQVASQARRMENQARGELLRENQSQMSDSMKQAGQVIYSAQNNQNDQAGSSPSENRLAEADKAGRLQQRFAGFFAAPLSNGADGMGLSLFA